jgi:hypothetical protein
MFKYVYVIVIDIATVTVTAQCSAIQPVPSRYIDLCIDDA